MPGSVNVELLFAVPRTELFSRLSALIAASRTFSAIVGFLTEEGVSLIADALAPNVGALSNLVVGAATLKACDGLNRLRSMGVPADRLRLHLGHSRRTTVGGFVKYHPMMHSKAYLFESPERSTAIIGSHNMTGFAPSGQNTEASVLLEAPTDNPLIQQVRHHISVVQGESQVYDPAMRRAYAWWYRQLFEGMQFKILYRSGDEEIEPNRNVVAIGVRPEQGLPRAGDVIYLEVPRAFGVLQALDQPVHFYLLSEMPKSVSSALELLPSCDIAFKGRVVGTNKGVVNEGDANWVIRDLRNPLLEPTAGQVFPAPSTDDLQAFIEISDVLKARYDYVFEAATKWQPVYDESEAGTVLATKNLLQKLESLDLIPVEHLPWYRVIGLAPADADGAKAFVQREVSPESGRFLLYSRARKPLGSFQSLARPDEQLPSISLVPSNVWFEAAKWAKEQDALKGWQRSLAFSLGKLASRKEIPSEKQAKQGKRLLLEAVQQGFEHAELTERILDVLRSEPT